ncbi:MAG: hypothetical protein ACI4MH_03425 [Candidatus Coproplasma sp.]
MGRTSEITDRRARRYIRITDDFKWEYIDRIMQRGEYRHSFNKVINDALDYGLPQLLKVAYGEIEEDGLPSTESQANSNIVVITGDDKKIDEIIDLLEEILLNITLTKSMTASLFNEKTKRLGGQTANPDSFESGVLSTTPPYLAEHERMVLNRVNKSRQERARRDEGSGN